MSFLLSEFFEISSESVFSDDDDDDSSEDDEVSYWLLLLILISFFIFRLVFLSLGSNLFVDIEFFTKFSSWSDVDEEDEPESESESVSESELFEFVSELSLLDGSGPSKIIITRFIKYLYYYQI